MKALSVQIEEIRGSINVRLENYKEAIEKYHSERLRLREVYFKEGFREDIAEKKAEEETLKIKQKVEAIGKELDKMVIVLKNIDADKINEEKQKIARQYESEKADGREYTKGVLVVDDAGFMRTLIIDTLTKSKYKVVGEADSGRSAYEKYKELMPELVVLDISMPDGDGLEALANIKDFDPNAKVVMCSQVTKQATVEEAIKLGALNFITKPFKADTFISVISKIIKP
jgi:two-component system chemotaxis response regulator CheY